MKKLVMLLALVLSIALISASCTSDDNASNENGNSSEVTTEPVEPSASSDGDDSFQQGTPASWEKITAPRPCACSDGSAFHFWVRKADPSKVLFYLSGGGACFSEETCISEPTYTTNLSGDTEPDEGIFSSHPDNPFADYSIVAVPYCTGDVHLGSQIHSYGEGAGSDIRHVGAINGVTALTTTAALFPDAEQVVVAGSSAGGAGSPLYAGLATDFYPDADIVTISDGAGGYPASPAISKAIGSLWGIPNAIPLWPGASPADSDAWTLPGLAVEANKHDPEIRFVRVDFDQDEVQEEFTAISGLGDDPLMVSLQGNEELIRSSGATVMSWIAAGNEHTVLPHDLVFDVTSDDLTLIDWLTAILNGEEVDNYVEAPA